MLNGFGQALAQATHPYREAGQRREADQREKDQWRIGQTELAVALHDTAGSGNARKILDTLKQIRENDREATGASPSAPVTQVSLSKVLAAAR